MSGEDDSALQEELEVLEAIYIDELEVIRNDSNKVTSITLQLHPATGDDMEKRYVCMTLQLLPSSEYPEEVPEIKIQNPRGIGEEELQSLLEDMHTLAVEKKGGPMLYELIELAKESLTEGNIPHCQCMICLEHFHEGDHFTRTDCYHYFHHDCLVRYVHHVMNQEPEQQKISLHMKQEEKQIWCPVCRKPITYDVSDLQSPLTEETLVFRPTAEMKELQRKMAAMLEIQRAKGGVIDVEAEKNKFLVSHEDFINLPATKSSEDSSEKSPNKSSWTVSDAKGDLRNQRTGRGHNPNDQRHEKDARRFRQRTYEGGFTDREEPRKSNSRYVRGKGRGKSLDDSNLEVQGGRSKGVKDTGQSLDTDKRGKTRGSDSARFREDSKYSAKFEQLQSGFGRNKDKVKMKGNKEADVTCTSDNMDSLSKTDCENKNMITDKHTDCAVRNEANCSSDDVQNRHGRVDGNRQSDSGRQEGCRVYCGNYRRGNSRNYWNRERNNVQRSPRNCDNYRKNRNEETQSPRPEAADEINSPKEGKGNRIRSYRNYGRPDSGTVRGQGHPRGHHQGQGQNKDEERNIPSSTEKRSRQETLRNDDQNVVNCDNQRNVTVHGLDCSDSRSATAKRYRGRGRGQRKDCTEIDEVTRTKYGSREDYDENISNIDTRVKHMHISNEHGHTRHNKGEMGKGEGHAKAEKYVSKGRSEREEPVRAPPGFALAPPPGFGDPLLKLL